MSHRYTVSQYGEVTQCDTPGAGDLSVEEIRDLVTGVLAIGDADHKRFGQLFAARWANASPAAAPLMRAHAAAILGVLRGLLGAASCDHMADYALLAVCTDSADQRELLARLPRWRKRRERRNLVAPCLARVVQ